VTPNPSLQRTRYSGLRPLSFAGELKRSFEGPLSTRSGFVVGAICLALVAGCAKETPDSLIHAAERHLAQRDYRAAQIELKNALQLAPNSGASYRLLGTTLLRGGDPTAAETALRRALALGERPDDVLPSLALALVRQGQPDRLTSEFGTRKLDNRSAAASFQTNLGQAWMMLGDSKQAGDAFEAALAHVPNYPPARLGQAQISAQHGRLDYASSIADDVLAADPRLTEAHAFKAQLHLSHGQRSEAVGSLLPSDWRSSLCTLAIETTARPRPCSTSATHPSAAILAWSISEACLHCARAICKQPETRSIGSCGRHRTTHLPLRWPARSSCGRTIFRSRRVMP
jgi:tetratricopeptide (TPR) repeat protein